MQFFTTYCFNNNMIDFYYNSNRENDISKGLIIRQRTDRIKALHYGFFHADYNSCGVIAVYNILQLTGRPAPMSQLINEFLSCHAAILGGLLGTNSFLIGRVLKKHGIGYKMFRGADKITEQGLYIICYFNPGFLRGAHAVAVKYDGENYRTYNLGGGISTRLPSDYAAHMICAYRLFTEDDK